MPSPDFRVAILPNGRMQTVGNGAAHQCVIGGVKFDEVDSPPKPVMRAQCRRLDIGKTGQILRIGVRDEAPKLIKLAPYRI